MGKIQTLPENLINQIAAGEVVERPASVVKELIENSLDAGASKIVVEIENGGKNLIKISDNGCGMDRDDLLKVFERHATSKIFTANDLWNIKTMGFRGEALASIASVSKVEFKTKRQEDLSGIRVENIGGKLSEIEDVGMNDGTIILVKDLFFNTPARQKFLKTDNTEFANIAEIITDFALGYPQIEFKFISNSKVHFDLKKTDDFEYRISQVLGKEIGKNLLMVDCFSTNPKLTGFVGKPEIARKTRQSQYLFVNGRPVKDNLISGAVADAFFSSLPEKKYPMFILFLQVDPMSVDVNVHPRKLEVRFVYKNMIYGVVKNSVKAVLEKEKIVPEIDGVARSYWNSEKAYGRAFVETHSNASVQTQSKKDNEKLWKNYKSDNLLIAKSMDFSRNFLNPEKEDLKDEKHIKVLGQVNLSYVVAADEQGIFIIDQHSAHERVMYEQLMNSAENLSAGQKQTLLIPIVIELSASEKALLDENREDFEKIGFEIEDFGKNSFQITAVPNVISKIDIKEVFLGILDDLNDDKKIKKVLEKEHELICYTACRSAIKFGQKLNFEEQLALVTQIDDLKGSTCPHGRPMMIRLTFDELEKRFGRK